MASLYSRSYRSKKSGKKTTYWYVAYIRDGKRHAKCAGPSKLVARELKKRIEGELSTGKFDFLIKPGDVRIEDSVSAYLEHVRTLRKPKTAERYQNALSHLQRFFRTKYTQLQVVRKLAPVHFTEYQGWRRHDPLAMNGRAGPDKEKFPTFKTINVELTVFRAWLNWAVMVGHIRENPLRGFKNLKTTDSKQRRTLDRDEIGRILEVSAAIEEERQSRGGQTQVWRFLVSTGLRVSELITLQWKDVDFRRKVIKIQRKPDWNPKTYEREVPLTDEAAGVLTELKGRTRKPENLVFTAANGRKLWPSHLREWLLDCANRVGIKDLHGPHDLRHTFITLALTEFGIDVPTVQKVVGHVNLATTQAYLHPTTDHMKAAIAKWRR